MAYDNKLKMDPDAVNTVAANVEDTQMSMKSVGTYAGASGLTAAHFGKTQFAQSTGQAFIETVKALATSVQKTDPYLGKVAAALRSTAQAQKLNDEDAKWGFDKLNKDS